MRSTNQQNRKQSSLLNTLFSLLVLLTCLVAPMGCTKVEPVQTQSISADISISVKDPIVRKITAITQQFDVVASGEFKAGTFMVRGKPLKIEEGTTFRLQLSLPIKDPKVISTKFATGELMTSKPLTVNAIPAPLKLELAQGKVTGEVDLVKTIGAFLFNVLQDQVVDTEGGGDWSQAIKKILVEESVLELRPGSTVEFGKQTLHIGDKSALRFENLVTDSAFNYTGDCVIDINFDKGCTYTGTKVDVDFNGGKMELRLSAKRTSGVVTLTSVVKQKPINLLDCTYKFGKQKLSTAHADAVKLNVDQFTWQKKEETDKPAFHFLSPMFLDKTKLHIHNTKLDLVALFPANVPSMLQIDRNEKAMEANFWTAQPVRADNADITLTKAGTNVLLKLSGALVGPITLTKSGDLQLSLAEGTATLKELEWTNGKKSLKLTTSGGSTLAITKGQSMDLTKDSEHTTCKLPLTLTLGNASINGTSLKLKLSKLKGTMMLDIDKDVNLDGKVNFTIAESNFLGDKKADVLVNGLNLNSAAGQSTLHLNDCSVVMPAVALEEEINKHVPEKKVYDLNQNMLAERKWRYKNFIIQDVTLTKPHLDAISFSSTNQAKFTASGDAEAHGTVDKTGIILKSKYETKPWSARAKLKGTGAVAYKFIPNQNLADSELSYSLAMELPMPDDIDLDWSTVSDGLLEKMERNAVIKSIQKVKPLPIKFDGKLKLFPDGTTRFKSLKVKNLKTKPSGSGTALTFSLDSVL